MLCSIGLIRDMYWWEGLAFFVVLFVIIIGISLLVKRFAPKKEETKDESSDAQSIVVVAEDTPAPGRSGKMTLFEVTDREAAMVMAILADELQEPLNTLQFVSIKKISEDK